VIGAQLRGVRNARDLSLAEAAKAAGITDGALSRIENGKREPTIETLTGLARALGVTFTINGDGITIGLELSGYDGVVFKAAS